MSVPVAPGRWPLLGHTPAMLRRRFRFTSALREHGDVVTLYLGPLKIYFVTSPELTHQVLVTDGPHFRKGIMFDRFKPFLGNGLVSSNGAFHLRQRRLMQPAFHRDHIARYAEIMVRTTENLISSWQPGEVRQIDHDMQAVAGTIVGEALFSTELGGAAIEEARRSIPLVAKQGMVRALSPAFVEKLPIPGNRQFDKAISRMRDIVLELIARHRADDTNHGDLLSMLLAARDTDTGEGMTDQQVFDEIITLLTGGIETSALALAWAFREIARHPDVERRLHAEVDEVLAGRRATADDVPRLVYTRQVINEVLRMYPIWFTMRRTLEEIRLGEVRIPPDSEVIISPHALHFDPRSFADPERFDPDRWAPEHAKDIPKGAFIPFGAGTRQCIGNAFAITEITLVLATVATRWRLVAVPDKPVRIKFTSAAYLNRLPMTAVPRE
ncbi:MAG: cytochrome P450 [Kutzneria sp.]|nr:cytochrome P450 [Kutzneria sp.]